MGDISDKVKSVPSPNPLRPIFNAMYSLGAVGLIIAGISYFTRPTYSRREAVLVGQPVSVEASSGSGFSGLSVVVRSTEGNVKLANIRFARVTYMDKVLDAAALIRSEIADTDNEPMTLRGAYVSDQPNVFQIQSIHAQGRDVEVAKY